MTRGVLRIYLGAAPGVGKTYAALAEAQRRAERGTDVVAGVVETHGREQTAAMLDGLELLPSRTVEYRGASFHEFDVDAAIRRRPGVLIVDELAHTNVPGSRNAKRWQDVEDVLAAGIDVISTVNVQHLESLNDVVARITGVPQRETVPDEVVRRADQVELADMAPEALRRRMIHGNIYPPDKIDAALSNYFRVGNLTALRELALLWLADKVEAQLSKYRRDKDIDATWESRERVVVALSGGVEGDTLIRRASRIAARSGADLTAVYVAGGDGLAPSRHASNLARQRTLVESIGGTFHEVVGDDIPDALLEFARGVNATQLVLGASRRGPVARLFGAGVGVTTSARSGSIDVHLVPHEKVAVGALARRTRPAVLSGKRRFAAYVMTLFGLPSLIALLAPHGDDLSLSSVILIVLTAIMAIAITGGILPALIAAVGGFALMNLFFTEPYHTFVVSEREQLLALVVFVMLAIAGATLVNVSARRARRAARASAEAQTLATLAGSVLRGGNRLPDLLEQLRSTFGMTAVALLERDDESTGPIERRDPDAWRVVASAGVGDCASPGEADVDIPIGDGLAVVLSGRPLEAADRRIVEVFAVHAVAALRQNRLAEEASAARRLSEADRMRTALLAAVSHDLRTPLASAKASLTGLADRDGRYSEAQRVELLATADESLNRLDRLVANLLDMSRLQAGSLGVHLVGVGFEEAVPPALDELGPAAADVRLRIADDLPMVSADPGLLERILVNVIGNALRFSPPDAPPTITASEHGGRVELRVIDYGPGIPDEAHHLVFTPFQRLGDRDNSSGVGLGLALSRGLAEAMSGTLSIEHTPGGGLTMVLALPSVEEET